MDEAIREEMIAILPRLRRFACGLAGSVADGDDLVQATCERAIANLDKWQAGTRLDSWMFRIAQNLHRNAVRDRNTRAGKLSELARDMAASLDGRHEHEERAALRAVQRFVAELPEDQRSILLLVCVEGRSYREVAEITGLPVGTVTSRLGRARARLREHLETGPSEEEGTEGAPPMQGGLR